MEGKFSLSAEEFGIQLSLKSIIFTGLNVQQSTCINGGRNK